MLVLSDNVNVENVSVRVHNLIFGILTKLAISVADSPAFGVAISVTDRCVCARHESLCNLHLGDGLLTFRHPALSPVLG
jgi:hypothetical protein